MQGLGAGDGAAQGLLPAALLQGRVRVPEGGPAAAADSQQSQHDPLLWRHQRCLLHLRLQRLLPAQPGQPPSRAHGPFPIICIFLWPWQHAGHVSVTSECS